MQVEVRQRGQELTITADGVALPLQAGDGRPMRAGPLGFYVMPGGTLEVIERSGVVGGGPARGGTKRVSTRKPSSNGNGRANGNGNGSANGNGAKKAAAKKVAARTSTAKTVATKRVAAKK